MNAVLQHKLPEVISILKKHKVKRAYAFGSVTRNDFHTNSDIDILVSFDQPSTIIGYVENFWSLEEELNRILERKVDIIPEHTLQNKYFIKEIERTKVSLYE